MRSPQLALRSNDLLCALSLQPPIVVGHVASIARRTDKTSTAKEISGCFDSAWTTQTAVSPEGRRNDDSSMRHAHVKWFLARFVKDYLSHTTSVSKHIIFLTVVVRSRSAVVNSYERFFVPVAIKVDVFDGQQCVSLPKCAVSVAICPVVKDELLPVSVISEVAKINGANPDSTSGDAGRCEKQQGACDQKQSVHER